MTEAVSFSQAPDLPLDVTTFVGRRSDRARIRELMGEFRVVTLTGFGGIGKTRLALRMATELRRAYEDVYVIALGGLTASDDVPDQIAAALGLHVSRASPTIAAVEYLKKRTALLVLDNCEHVVEVAAVATDTFLRTCPGVHILATSREPLRIDGEVEYPVAPLSVPAEISSEPLQQYDAVRLFLDRARAIVPDFALTEENRTAVATVSRKLEGIPLAIELAAARLRAFTLTELAAQLTDRWELLGKGTRTAPNRHSTMAACIEWSFDLCTAAERGLWAKASVFVDGFELDAVEAVCADRHDVEPIKETLASLVEKSVVTASPYEGMNRYRMLSPIRHRGRTELVRLGWDTDLRRSHKEFFVDLAARSSEEWFGPHQLDCIGRLRRDMGNLRKALELCAVESAWATDGLLASANLLEFGLIEGHFQQARRWLDRILATHAGDPESRARALRAACFWAAIQGDIDSATSQLEEGQALAARLEGETATLLTQAAGFVALFAGDPGLAEPLLSQASREFTTSGNNAELALCSVLLALDHTLLGDTEIALQYHRTCLAITEAAGETWLRSWSLWIAGLALWTRGDATAASELVRNSLDLKRRIAEPLGIAVLLETLAWFASASNPEHAAMLLGAAENEWAKIDTTTQVLPGLGSPHRESTEALLTRLGEAAFDAARSHGRRLDQATAIAFALNEQPTQPAEGTNRPGARPSQLLLTRRERQVAELIYKGLSNKAIADTLVISRRTAETHVEHILTKLGFTSRAQVAAWFGEHLRVLDR
jgi:serine/threonine-protein kinase PknK